jgi:SAM-dependent methyltransferase
MQIPQNWDANSLNRFPESLELVPAAGARILLVGAWDAGLPQELKRRGAAQVVGLVPVGGVAGTAGLDAVHTAELRAGLTLPYSPGHFDVVWLDDALERTADPAATLRTLRGFTKDTGRLICHVANVRNEWVIMRLLVDGDWAKATDGVIKPEHARCFTRRDLDRVLADAAMELEGDVLALRSQPSAWLDAAAELVGKLGGNVEKFRAEATVVRFVVVAASRARTTPPSASRCRRVG